MFVTKVVDNEVQSDGTINSKVRVRSPIPSEAKNRAIRRAILYNGYSPAIKFNDDVTASAGEATDVSVFSAGQMWLVDVAIKGI